MTQREAIVTLILALCATMSAVSVPLMADASGKIIIGTGMASFAGSVVSLLGALALDPRSKFGGGDGNG